MCSYTHFWKTMFLGLGSSLWPSRALEYWPYILTLTMISCCRNKLSFDFVHSPGGMSKYLLASKIWIAHLSSSACRTFLKRSVLQKLATFSSNQGEHLQTPIAPMRLHRCLGPRFPEAHVLMNRTY